MMSLLSVTVKKARYVGAQAPQFNTYVTLKLQNVKSTTVTVKGATPCWEQDFLFETNDLNTGLLIEVWSKGMIWDRAMGYTWIPLQTVQYSNEEGNGQWLSLEAELVMRDGEVVGTKSPTGHSLLVDCRFELPFDPENIEASDLQRKLEMLNNIMDQEARMEQARRQMQYYGHSGYSEDSDYTSDLNYPVGQHANSSASQFRSAAHQIHTPQRSLETSRENSYERDDAPHQQHHLPTPQTHQHHLSPGSHKRHHQRFSPGTEDYSYATPNTGHGIRPYQDNNTDSDPLFYNSRPRNKTDYSSQDTWASCETSFYNQSVDSVDVGFSVDSEYFAPGSQQFSRAKARRRSLERQNTLYDESTLYGDPSYYSNENVTQANCLNIISSQQGFNQNKSCDEFFDTLSFPFQEERYGQDEEDRQWDSGGYNPPAPRLGSSKKLPQNPMVQNINVLKRRPSLVVDEGYPSAATDIEPFRSTHTPTAGRRKMPQVPTRRCNSRQSEIFDGYCTPDNSSHRGASLPPTPTRTPKMLPRINAQAKAFNSLPPTPGRQLPKPNMNRSAKQRRNSLMKRTSSAEYGENEYDNFYTRPGAVSAREVYNEDYNYAYQSIDNLPAEEPMGDTITVTTMNAKNGLFQQDEYASYNNTAALPDQDDYYDRRKKLLAKQRGNSPLLHQQNTDSLESRDDDLKDSFETAVSSISSSLHQLKKFVTGEFTSSSSTTNQQQQQQQQQYKNEQQYPANDYVANEYPVSYPNEYSVAQQSMTAQYPVAQYTSNEYSSAQYPLNNKYNATEQIMAPEPTLIVTSTMQYNRDQSPPKAIVTSTALPSVTVVQVHNNHQAPKAQSRGLLKQQDSVDVTYLNQAPIIGYLPQQDSFEQPYLETQESVESYIEGDGEYSNGKAINHDSPCSVIHVGAEDELSLRRGSSQITVVDPYHPSLQRNSVDQYGQTTRRSSTDFQRRTSSDSYQQNALAQNDDAYLPPSSRKTSFAEPYASGAPPRRSSLHVSPPEHHDDVIPEEDHLLVVDDDVPEKKSVSFEEEEDTKQLRPQVTAQQRWLWAYNKIIMQLNVSLLSFPSVSALFLR